MGFSRQKREKECQLGGLKTLFGPPNLKIQTDIHVLEAGIGPSRSGFQVPKIESVRILFSWSLSRGLKTGLKISLEHT